MKKSLSSFNTAHKKQNQGDELVKEILEEMKKDNKQIKQRIHMLKTK